MVDKKGEELFIEGNNRERKTSIRQHNRALDDGTVSPDDASAINAYATTATASSADPSVVAEISELETQSIVE